VPIAEAQVTSFSVYIGENRRSDSVGQGLLCAPNSDIPIYTEAAICIVVSATQVGQPFGDLLLYASLHFGRDRQDCQYTWR
jgi:hypothetical protein